MCKYLQPAKRGRPLCGLKTQPEILSLHPGARSAAGAAPLVVRRRKLYKNNSARLNLLRILSFYLFL